jgi:hypothetical protein
MCKSVPAECREYTSVDTKASVEPLGSFDAILRVLNSP